MAITSQSLSRWEDYEKSMASDDLVKNLRKDEGLLD